MIIRRRKWWPWAKPGPRLEAALFCERNRAWLKRRLALDAYKMDGELAHGYVSRRGGPRRWAVAGEYVVIDESGQPLVYSKRGLALRYTIIDPHTVEFSI